MFSIYGNTQRFLQTIPTLKITEHAGSMLGASLLGISRGACWRDMCLN
jgi:hypothetical protein